MHNKEAVDIVIKTGFKTITHNIAFQPATVAKGKNLALAEHVKDIEEHRRNNNSFIIKARIIRQAWVHSTPHITSLKIHSERYVTDVHCNCVYNQSKKCKHVAALVYFTNNDESASETSNEQQWANTDDRAIRSPLHIQRGKGTFTIAQAPWMPLSVPSHHCHGCT
ncbi:hypothetical protein PV327_010099 [Microctonus hyperodae]|uniref:SWIM-type domain-containing protein n=1 Tax=Microctonus hyperodae TaxID=165561 RepID=A0AA39F2D1_MICHY|nr:hypothetical protein PV327_010099 [Microctonus hyperodae]